MAFRSYGPKHRWGGLLTPAIKWLIIANTAVFLFQTLTQLLGGPGATRWLIEMFGLVPYAVTHSLRVWQPFTYLFLHGGLWHVLINLLVLWMFGSDLERAWGRQRFLQYYFVCGVGAGLINVVVKTLMDWRVDFQVLPAEVIPSSMIATIGASGAIYGVLLAAAVVFPDRQVWLIPFPVMLPMRAYVLIIGAIAFFSSLGSSDNVSHVTHLGGMLVGYLYMRRGSHFSVMRNLYSDWQRRRARRRFDVYVKKHREEPPSRPDRWTN